MKKFFNTHKAKIIDLAVVLGVLSIILFWVFHITPDMNNILAGPDEAMRFMIPNFIFEHGYIPTGYETAIHGNWSYAYYPQLLGAIVSSIFMEIVSLFTKDPAWLVWAARLTSVLFGVIAALFVRRSTRLLLGNSRYKGVIGNLSLVLFALLPQVTFLSSYVNNDIIALAGVSIIVYACISVYKTQLSIASSAWFAAGVVFAVLGYLNSYGFVLAGFIYMLVKLIQWYKEVKNKRMLLKYILILFGIPALLCLPFFIRNMFLYGGDLFGVSTFRIEYLKWVAETGIVLQTPYHEGLLSLLFANRWPLETIKSFVMGYFGGWGRGLGDIQYNAYYVLAGVGLVGLVAYLRQLKAKSGRKLLWALLFLSIAITVGLTLYYTLRVDYQPQGRYIIYIVIPLVLGIAVGLAHLVKTFIKPQYVNYALILIGLLYGALHLSIIYKTFF